MKTPVEERIEQAPACPVINLTGPEMDIYTGAGYKIALFQKGRLAKIHDPMEQSVSDDTHADMDQAVNAAIVWIRTQTTGVWDEVWAGTFSAGQICDPQPVKLLNPLAIAKMARKIREALQQ